MSVKVKFKPTCLRTFITTVAVVVDEEGVGEHYLGLGRGGTVLVPMYMVGMNPSP